MTSTDLTRIEPIPLQAGQGNVHSGATPRSTSPAPPWIVKSSPSARTVSPRPQARPSALRVIGCWTCLCVMAPSRIEAMVVLARPNVIDYNRREIGVIPEKRGIFLGPKPWKCTAKQQKFPCWNLEGKEGKGGKRKSGKNGKRGKGYVEMYGREVEVPSTSKSNPT